MMRTELNPRFTNQKSFYKKAHILQEGDVYTLESYTTRVMQYDKTARTLGVFGDWSSTTRRHQWEFMNWVDDLGNGEYFVNVYNHICKEEKIKSFAQFLREVDVIDLKNHTYKLNRDEQVKSFV